MLDKENAAHRKGIFMIDASKGFVKDGNKNRLREQDIRKITDTFYAMSEIPKFSRTVPMTEIADPKNDYNLNIPRYIDTQEAEDLQNIAAHLEGGIPEADIAALSRYWQLFPTLRKDLFSTLRSGFLQLKQPISELKNTIFGHPEFLAFNEGIQSQFDNWLATEQQAWEKLSLGCHPKSVIEQAGERLLRSFEHHVLLDNYDLYQHLMQYWNEQMQDDIYSISIDGWEAGKQWQRLIIKAKKGKDGKAGKDKEIPGLEGVEGRMISPQLLIAVYFKNEQDKIAAAEQQIEQLQARMSEIEEEQAGEDGLFADLEKVNVGEITKLLKAKKQPQKTNSGMAAEPESTYSTGGKDEIALLEEYIAAAESIKKTNASIKTAKESLEKQVLAQYAKLNEADIKNLVIAQKWRRQLYGSMEQEKERLSQALTARIKELAERYEKPLPLQLEALKALEEKVKVHLANMGFLWK